MIGWWGLLVLVIVVLVVLVALWSREDRWTRGRGYRCNFVDPVGHRCELDHLHVADFCVTHDKYGGRHQWKGLNWEWDPEEQVFTKRPESWKGLS